MTGTKLLFFGGLLVFLALALLAILCIPNAPFLLLAIFTQASIFSSSALLDPPIAAATFLIHLLGLVASFLLLAGLLCALLGLFRRD